MGQERIHSFSFSPGDVPSFEFPDPVKHISLGDSNRFKAHVLDERWVVVKALTTELNLFTGLKVHLTNGDVVGLRLQTTELSKSDNDVVFYRGKSPFDQVLKRERKKLEMEYRKKSKNFEGKFWRRKNPTSCKT